MEEVRTDRSLIQFDIQVPEEDLIFALVPARHAGKWIWGQKEGSESWEFPGGHIEPGESALQAAKRELHEECGALAYEIWPICQYAVRLKRGAGWSKPVYGQLFYARVDSFEPLQHEIARISLFDSLPPRLSYPDIQPHLLTRAIQFLEGRKA